jgi:hypothetical protein
MTTQPTANNNIPADDWRLHDGDTGADRRPLGLRHGPMTRPLTRQQINRRAAAVRLAVLRRLRTEHPDLYGAWVADAYAALDRNDSRAADPS